MVPSSTWSSRIELGERKPVRFLLFLFGCPVVSDSLWLCGLQHSRPPCPSPSPKVCPNFGPYHCISLFFPPYPTPDPSETLGAPCESRKKWPLRQHPARHRKLNTPSRCWGKSETEWSLFWHWAGPRWGRGHASKGKVFPTPSVELFLDVLLCWNFSAGLWLG